MRPDPGMRMKPVRPSAATQKPPRSSTGAGVIRRLVHRETLLYGACGVLTTLLNVGLFRVLLLLPVDYKLANIITLVVVKLTAYVLNKFLVFQSRTPGFLAFCREFLRYLTARGFTLLVDYFGLILLVSRFGLDEMAGKWSMTILVVGFNYILGKFIVFTNKRSCTEGGTMDDNHSA